LPSCASPEPGEILCNPLPIHGLSGYPSEALWTETLRFKEPEA